MDLRLFRIFEVHWWWIGFCLHSLPFCAILICCSYFLSIVLWQASITVLIWFMLKDSFVLLLLLWLLLVVSFNWLYFLCLILKILFQFWSLCRWTPYGTTKCIICKQQVHQDGKYCHTCAYTKGIFKQK